MKRTGEEDVVVFGFRDAEAAARQGLAALEPSGFDNAERSGARAVTAAFATAT